MANPRNTSDSAFGRRSTRDLRSPDDDCEGRAEDPQAVLQVVPARPEDAHALRDRAVESFLDDYSTYGAMPPRIEEEIFHAQHIANGHYYAIRHQRELAGAILVEPKGDDVAEIALFFVTPPYQNQRIGGRALALVERRYPHVVTWQLVTPSSDPRNRHFYERHGYRRVGTMTPEGPLGPTVTRYEKRAG